MKLILARLGDFSCSARQALWADLNLLEAVHESAQSGGDEHLVLGGDPLSGVGGRGSPETMLKNNHNALVRGVER